MDLSLIIAIISTVAGVGSFLYQRREFLNKKEQLSRKTEELEQLNILNSNLEIIENLSIVFDRINKLIREEILLNKVLLIKNYGLDLEQTLPWLKRNIDEKVFKNINIEYRGLLINPDASINNELIDGESNIRTSCVLDKISLASSIRNMQLSNVKVEIKKYDIPPIIHGFNINDKYLFIGFTRVSKGKLTGGADPYLFLNYNSNSNISEHYFDVYNSWFDFLWNKGGNS